jgi:tRNA A-37 threonylcarbamoyl transferase component Bud32
VAIVNALIAAIEAGNLELLLPQTLSLHNGESLYCEQLLRLLPGKRGVFKARYRDQPVLAKIFLDSAARQLRREHDGYTRLISAQQPTPKLIASVNLASGTALLYEFLTDAQPLFREDVAPSMSKLELLLDRLQSMYAAGIYHDDLHWGNFLLLNNTAFVIDAGAVLGNPVRSLTTAEALDNLGLLIAQFRRCDQSVVITTVQTHALCTQFKLTSAALATTAEAHWKRRKHALLLKCFRDTTATSFLHTFNRIYAYRRASAGTDLDKLLRNPDAVMAHGQALKLGNSATVVKLEVDGRNVVIKRYNVKNIWHWLRRCWRPSRAWTSWRNAHWLELLGLQTPTPIAFLEMRCGFLRGRAYYVCEFIEGNSLAHELGSREPSSDEVAEFEKYFAVAAKEHLIHGDMKANNFLLRNGRLTILDLDAMREIKSHSRWLKLFKRDFARFERNILHPNTAWFNSLRTLVARLTAATS